VIETSPVSSSVTLPPICASTREMFSIAAAIAIARSNIARVGSRQGDPAAAVIAVVCQVADDFQRIEDEHTEREISVKRVLSHEQCAETGFPRSGRA